MYAGPTGATERAYWDLALETGDRTIDWGNMHLFAFLNDITVAVLASSPRHEIKDAVVELLRQIETHLAAEENLMKACGYAGFAEQQAAHEQVARDLSEAIAVYLTDWDSSVEPVLDCARTWLQEHVSTLDRDLAEYLRALREEALH